MYVPILIVGSGIAGMSVAYNLSQKNIEYLVITKASHFLKSNSAISPANMRFFSDYKKGIELYIEQCGGNYETIESIYSNQDFLLNTFKNLNIKTKKTPIGIIPDNDKNTVAGPLLLNSMKNDVKNILVETFLIDIKINESYIECLVYNKDKGFFHINCGILVVSTGGFANLFQYNDNSCTATGECTYILQKYTNKLKGLSTIMFHPFGIQNGKRILTGDIVSLLDDIYEKDNVGNFLPLKMKSEIFNAIKTNSYHSNKIFIDILETFNNKEVYLKFDNVSYVKKMLIKNGYSTQILIDNLIRVCSTAHYTSGGIVVDKSFKVSDRIFANGEIIFDGNIGIGRLPGHPFASSIISGKIIADEIEKMKFEKILAESNFEIYEKIKLNDDKDCLIYNNMLNQFFIDYGNLSLQSNINKSSLIDFKKRIEESLKIVYNNIKSIKELNIYYRMCLLYEIIKDKIMEVL